LGLPTLALPTAIGSNGEPSTWQGVKQALPLTTTVKEISDEIDNLKIQFNELVDKINITELKA
jgi:hypothetical protein